MANENKDVIRVFDTAANLPTVLRNGQFGYDTTNDRIGVKRLADGQMVWFENADDTDRTDIVIDDNSATAFRVREASNNYFAVDTTDSDEHVYIGNLATNPKILLYTAGSVYINDYANAKMTTGLTIKGTAGDEMLALKSGVAHGVTDEAETDTYCFIKDVSGVSGNGGALFEALTDTANTDPAIHLKGIIAGNDATYQAVIIEARKNYGTGTTTINDTTRILVLKNGASEKVTFGGDGTITTAGKVLIPSGGYVGSAGDTTALQIDANGNIIGDLVMPTSAPSNPVAGSFYYDDTGNFLYIYDGSGWDYAVITDHT